MQIQNALQEQYDVILDRKTNDGGEKSYTNYLYREGLNKILKKCGEECFEVVIAAKNQDEEELAMCSTTSRYCWAKKMCPFPL